MASNAQSLMQTLGAAAALPMPPPPPQIAHGSAVQPTVEAQPSPMTLPMPPPPPPAQTPLLPVVATTPPPPPPPAPPAEKSTSILPAVTPPPLAAQEPAAAALPAPQQQESTGQDTSSADSQAVANAEATSETAKKAAPMGIKFLVDATEAAYIRGQDVSLVELQKKTNARIVISQEHYPGCLGLHEVRILAASTSAVLNAMLNVLGKVTEAMGKLSGGDEVEYGSARLKLLVPARAAAAIIGPGGQNVREITNQSNAKINVDMNAIPLTAAMAEQALALGGPIHNVCSALPPILEYIADFAPEKWFKGWIVSSNAGRTIPGLVLWMPKGRGKGAGKAAFANTEAQQAQIAAALQATAVGTSPALVVPPSIDTAALVNAGVDPAALVAAVASEGAPMPTMPPSQENLLLQLLAQPQNTSTPAPLQ